MDFCGPPLKTKNGNVLIFVIIDHCSRWVELIALKKAGLAEVMLALQNIWLPKHGVPAAILSDNGPQFTAGVVQYFCRGRERESSIAFHITHKKILMWKVTCVHLKKG